MLTCPRRLCTKLTVNRTCSSFVISAFGMPLYAHVGMLIYREFPIGIFLEIKIRHVGFIFSNLALGLSLKFSPLNEGGDSK